MWLVPPIDSYLTLQARYRAADFFIRRKYAIRLQYCKVHKGFFCRTVLHNIIKFILFEEKEKCGY